MADAVNNTVVKTDTLLQKTAGKGFGFMQSFIRQYQGFAYLGFSPINWYEAVRNVNGKNGEVLHKLVKFNDMEFTKIEKIEGTITEDGKKVQWYEGNAFSTKAKITADSTANTVVVDKTSTYAVNDRVRTMPEAGSTGTSTNAVITAINSGTKTITLDGNVNVKAGDYLLFVNSKLTIGNKVERTIDDPDAKLVTTYFGKYGASVKLEQVDLNKNRLLDEAKNWIAKKFAQPRMQVLENIVTTWFFGSNVGGNEPEAQGIETVIAERTANGLTSVHDLSGAADDKAKVKAMQDVLNLAATAPVYMGSEKPTVYCTTAFSAEVARWHFESIIFNDMQPKKLEYGLDAFTTPYFQNITFVTSTEMDRIYGASQKVAFVFPKELIGFRTPENETVDSNGVAVKTQTNKFSVIRQPITTKDFVEYTTEFYLANIFAGQSYENTYKKITL